MDMTINENLTKLHELYHAIALQQKGYPLKSILVDCSGDEEGVAGYCCVLGEVDKETLSSITLTKNSSLAGIVESCMMMNCETLEDISNIMKWLLEDDCGLEAEVEYLLQTKADGRSDWANYMALVNEEDTPDIKQDLITCLKWMQDNLASVTVWLHMWEDYEEVMSSVEGFNTKSTTLDMLVQGQKLKSMMK